MVDGGESSINTYGYDDRADLKVKTIDLYRDGNLIGIDLELDGVIKDTFKVGTPGKFSSYNAMSAILTCYLMGIDVKYMSSALKDFSVKGRVEPVEVSKDFTLLIDYAHNGVSTESILTTIREYNPKRIVTIFGCGGNRSRDRRYEMGEIAGKYSDFCIITEDNNRFEENEDIAIALWELAASNGSEEAGWVLEYWQEGDIDSIIKLGTTQDEEEPDYSGSSDDWTDDGSLASGMLENKRTSRSE
jgi:UDP-N-acetylmuramoyl-L-alanyl-D-glutamate--2,6-diaminopimelate ligase